MGKWEHKLGLIVPSWNTVMEYEVQRMAGGAMSVHSMRIPHTADTEEKLLWLATQAADAERLLAHALISSGYSPEGAAKATMIMSLEEILWRQEQEKGRAQEMVDQVPERVQRFLLVSGMDRLWRMARDPESYYITIFGEPSPERTWGWRLEGHHVSLNATLVDGRELVIAPSFFGANPRQIRHGPRAGLRVLAAEEDLARQLVQSLDEGQRARAVIAAEAPADILTYNHRRAQPFGAEGITADTLTPEQRERLMALLETYASAMPAEIAAARMAQVTAAPASELRFAWAGSTAPAGPCLG
ncbi:MAG: DUF3500 domain-containing protein [Dehalococcoidia bacterium]|nr:DUF3500 domain-containing protein [Dehalococcoidia bacterium]